MKSFSNMDTKQPQEEENLHIVTIEDIDELTQINGGGGGNPGGGGNGGTNPTVMKSALT